MFGLRSSKQNLADKWLQINLAQPVYAYATVFMGIGGREPWVWEVPNYVNGVSVAIGQWGEEGYLMCMKCISDGVLGLWPKNYHCSTKCRNCFTNVPTTFQVSKPWLCDRFEAFTVCVSVQQFLVCVTGLTFFSLCNGATGRQICDASLRILYTSTWTFHHQIINWRTYDRSLQYTIKIYHLRTRGVSASCQWHLWKNTSKILRKKSDVTTSKYFFGLHWKGHITCLKKITKAKYS